VILQFFEYLERDSILHKINPVVKLLLILTLMVIITFIYDPYTPIIFSIIAIIQITVLGKIPIKAIFKMILPLTFILIGITITSIISYDVGAEKAPQIILAWKFIQISKSSIIFGLTIGFRIFCFLLYSLLFVVSTDPTDFILSLIIQLRLSPKIGFGTLAGYRFVPILNTEYQNIYDAHKIRGVKERSGLIEKIKRAKKYTVPLMLSATRKAQRVAIAMDSKCFYAYPKRTYLRDIKIRKIDIIYIILFTALCIAIFAILIRFNILNWGYRSLR
jgi:energy-coupling factor transport system permease protein